MSRVKIDWNLELWIVLKYNKNEDLSWIYDMDDIWWVSLLDCSRLVFVLFGYDKDWG